MGITEQIELGIIDRLGAAIDGIESITRQRATSDGRFIDAPVQIKSYPAHPNDTSLKSLSASGALLVRYTGSRYGKARKGAGFFVQDRTMLYEVVCVSESLIPASMSSGIYRMLDLAALRLIGFCPEGAVGDIELVQDDYLSETKGTWEYGIVVSVKAQTVKRHE
jgi:hypothetical protein